MTTLAQVILRDIATNRPAAATAGRLFYDTTAGKWQRDTGADWEDCEPGSSAPDAAAVTYTPAVAADWDSDADPGDVDQALDQLAERVDDLEGAGYITGIDAAAVTYTPGTAADWDSDTDPGDVDQALDQLAERVDDLEGAGGSGDVTWAIIQAAQLANEVMGYPANVGIDVDLVAGNLWWDSVGTPSTAATMVDVAGEAGITETWEYALKCITDANTEGLYQRFTYADQPRVKAGRKLSAIAAVWVGTAGRTVTMALTTSQPTTVSATATAQGWTILTCENLTLDGTYVDLKFTVDGADTIYIVPLGVNIGEKAVPLPPRTSRYVDAPSAALVSDVDPGATAWTDLDLTASTSPLTWMVQLHGIYANSTAGHGLHIRRKGSTTSKGLALRLVRACVASTNFEGTGCFVTDDNQVIEWGGSETAGHTEGAYIYVKGYWEWA